MEISSEMKKSSGLQKTAQTKYCMKTILLSMAYQPKGKARKHILHEYKRSLHEKRKIKNRLRRPVGEPKLHEPVATEKEISERTLKQLHTLGIQKFGLSPFSEHFERWLFDVEAVIGEFEAYPAINLDNQFLIEREQTIAAIKRQLEERQQKEVLLNQEIEKLSPCPNRLAQINSEYATAANEFRRLKNPEIKQLLSSVNRLKKEQDKVIRLKTGFFRGISKKEREQKETEISLQLDEMQNKLELAMLNFKAEQKALREKNDAKKEPVLEQIKQLRKMVQLNETDDSLEERWLACEALIDSVNSFLQRKAAQHH